MREIDLRPLGGEPNAPLGARTTYRVGGNAAWYIEVGSEERLVALSQLIGGDDRDLPILLLGRGSNLLVADRGFDGLVVRLTDELAQIEIDSQAATVRAGGGADIPVVARRCVEAGLSGFEWAVGVPGTIGGAVAMNAGGHGADTRETLVRYRSLDLYTQAIYEGDPQPLRHGYRSSNLAKGEVVIWAEIALSHGDVQTSKELLAEIVRWRRANQPGGSNAGSVFTNPPGDSAGRLIDAAGLKGLRINSAHVSLKHANFIQADEGGSADDVYAVMIAVQKRVEEAFGVRLHPEVRLVGFAPFVN